MILLAGACSPPKAEPVKTVTIRTANMIRRCGARPIPWNTTPRWKSKEPNPANLSKYRKGWTGKEKFDKLSEFPVYGSAV